MEWKEKAFWLRVKLNREVPWEVKGLVKIIKEPIQVTNGKSFPKGESLWPKCYAKIC